jgi:uncharacterized membrane protein YczE
MAGVDPLKKRLQISGILLIIGLLIEAACLFSPRPIAFVIFVAVGGLLMFAGMALYLFSLVETPANQ